MILLHPPVAAEFWLLGTKKDGLKPLDSGMDPKHGNFPTQRDCLN